MSETFILWALGSCGIGFLFLLVRVIQLSVDMKERVTMGWIEDNLSKSFDNKVDRRHTENQQLFHDINNELKEIKGAIIGTITSPGVIARLANQDRIIDRIETQIKKLCDGCKYYKDHQ